MTRARVNIPTFNFSKGKVTEASPLTFPENSAQVLTNTLVNLDGTVQRRLGIDFETNHAETGLRTLERTLQEATSTFTWKTVAGVGGLDFFVVQRGYVLDFYSLGQASLSGGYVGALDLTTQALPGTSVNNVQRIQFSSGRGALFIAEATLEPSYIVYDDTTNTFTIENITIEVRDFEGVEDNVGIDERPETLSALHAYNIKNQGWFMDEVIVFNAGLENPIVRFFNERGSYPSNADLLSASMVGAQDDGAKGFTSSGVTSKLEGNTQAPKGHYLLNAFDRDKSQASGVSGLPSTPVKRRPSTTAFFAGRVWYAGTPDSELGGSLFFSQLLTDLNKSGKCYQDQDPTAIELNALLATDGGVIEIPEAGRILKLLPFRRSVIVFATNGIWSVDGGLDSGFDAENFAISKISNVDTVSASTVIETDQGIFFWSTGGIYTLAPAESTGAPSVSNISEATVQTDYLAISATSKQFASAFYDRPNSKLFWMYSSENSGVDLEEYIYGYDRILNLDLKLGAFTDTHLVRTSISPIVIGGVPSEGPTTTQVVGSVTVNGDGVQVNGDDVIAEFPLVLGGSSGFKYLTLINNLGTVTTTFSEFNNTGWADWETQLGTGIDAPAQILTGHQLLEDSSRRKQIDYFTIHFNRTENNFIDDGAGNLILDFPSSCLIQTRWDWTSTSSAGKWSSQFQGYRLNRFYAPDVPGIFDYSYDVVTTKSKIRGRGRAIAFQFLSEEGKDMQLLGWDVLYSGGQRV